MLDKNNTQILIGDIVKIEKSPIKSDNAIYVVAQDGTSKLYNGSDLTLYKVAKHKEGYSLSKSSNNICFYPLCNFSNKYKYSKEEMNMATIEVLLKADSAVFNIIKNDDKYEEEETEETYFNATVKNNDGTIEDVSYASSEKEKIIAFFSNITLKQGEFIEIEKQDRSWGYYRNGIKYELVSTKPMEEIQITNSINLEQSEQHQSGLTSLSYEIIKDVDTRDNSVIWVVKVKEKLSREEYKQVNDSMGNVGGYYSRFKHGFIFKSDPSELLASDLSSIRQEEKQTEAKTQPEEPKEQLKPIIKYDIAEDKGLKDSKIVYLVKVKNDLSKADFAELKRNLAKIGGFHSSIKDGFIFKYDPTEKLIV